MTLAQPEPGVEFEGGGQRLRAAADRQRDREHGAEDDERAEWLRSADDNGGTDYRCTA